MNVRRSNKMRILSRAFKAGRQRGAALVMTIMVILVLSMLGLAMVAFTGTEARSSVVYRDTLQTRALAEGGIRIVQMMFADPTDRTLVPLYHTGTSANSAWDYYGNTSTQIETSLNAIGIWRADRSPISPARYTGPNNGFFRGPFANDWSAVFGGTYNKVAASNKYDIKFNCTNPATNAAVGTTCWLNKINALLLGSGGDWNNDSGSITDISFYGPPVVDDVPYGITTVRVTAEKYANGELIAREVMEAVIGDITKKPSVLGNGNVVYSIPLCGDGCEQIHANGTLLIGTPAAGAGEAPVGTSTSTVNGSNTPPAGSQPSITAPEINPWDLAYKPTTTTGLDKYYLLAARPLDTWWNNNLDDDNYSNAQTQSPEPCGNNSLSLCEDYNLEYDRGTAGSPGTPRAAKAMRTTASVATMYKWDRTHNEWDYCDNTSPLTCGAGTPEFTVTPANDTLDADGIDAAGKADNADLPFNIRRVPRTEFRISSGQTGATVLIDGTFYKHGNFVSTMSIIAVGSIHLHSQTTWAPALTNRIMWLSGRDVYHQSNCCAPANQCATNVNSNQSSAGIIASHEQYQSGNAYSAQLGLLIAEHRINLDTVEVNSNTTAIYSDNGTHGSVCGMPDWPWSLPTKTAIFSIKSVPD